MRLDYFIVLGLALIGTATVVVFQDKMGTLRQNEAIQAFKQFKIAHSQNYLSHTEESYRLSVFIDNYLLIQEHNSNPNNTYKLGINQYSDLTKEEFKNKYLMKVAPPTTKNLPVGELKLKDAPTTVNWANVQNILPPVKDQGQCGSCWSFSTAGMLEGIFNMNNKSQTQANSFSEQQLVDCCGAMGFGCEGCSGAWPTDAVSYVQKYGIVQESQYTYNAQDNACQTQKQNVGYKPGQQFQVPVGDANLRQAVAQQPISICVDASVWYTYSSGVFNNCSSDPNEADHAVLLVGYDASNNWIVRNSWGTSWGNAGYITLAQGNTCGLQNYAIYANYQ